jgi:hypothetical protein
MPDYRLFDAPPPQPAMALSDSPLSGGEDGDYSAYRPYGAGDPAPDGGAMGTGLWRDGHWVQVSYGGREFVAISRTLYGARGYLPSFDELPTKEEYEAGTP